MARWTWPENFQRFAAAEASGLDADAMLVAPERDSRPPVQEQLTPREIQVMELLAEGLPNKAIAVRLGISDQTVKFHVSSISENLVRRTDRRGKKSSPARTDYALALSAVRLSSPVAPGRAERSPATARRSDRR